jgi:precorrin-6B methylase 1
MRCQCSNACHRDAGDQEGDETRVAEGISSTSIATSQTQTQINTPDIATLSAYEARQIERDS